MELYHFQLGIPERFNTNYGIIELKYSTHAIDKANRDRYKWIDLPRTIDTSKARVIEIEVENEKVIKVVYRLLYDEEYDLIMVVVPIVNLVKTVWLNMKNDEHKTLNKERYKHG